jgi:hypothetical protein
MGTIKLAAAMAALLLSVGAAAGELELDACAFATAPELVDGSIASEQEMQATSRAVRAYHDAMQSALACLEQAEQSLGEDITDTQRAQVNTLYNQGFDQLQNVATDFNEQVRLFKAR